ncbi:type IIL restriction-modification enzyme MmeI [Janibacter sp. GXQ6167]|uniref:type IIL restriction-modification enzyme MmeI n=1 Tax=Janibacter sp. GXQ6167 TaxID=3240791 RepID=UPI003526119A
MIATNTVAQGDTREVGLDVMVTNGFTITRAIQSRSWPASSANLEYAAVWGTVETVPEDLPRVADGADVRRISTLLEPVGRVAGLPSRLAENAGISFIGSIVNGVGFTMPPEVASEMLAEDDAANRVIFPYLTGEDTNSRPDASASRYVVDFTGMSQAEAMHWRRPFAWVEEHVRPHRSTLTNKPKQQEEWWLYERPGPAMRRAIAGLPEVLVIARVSKTVMPLRVPTGQVVSEACVVFATDAYGDQAVLSSSLHQLWAITYGSGMRNDPRYTPSDVFETFPRPRSAEALEQIGRLLDEKRRKVMIRRDLGLTKLYNLMNDPAVASEADSDVARMRAIHTELDRAVLAAYGWSDLSLGHGFHEYRKIVRWTVGPDARTEILDRLLEENQRRAALESTGRRPERRSDAAHESATLFD